MIDPAATTAQLEEAQRPLPRNCIAEAEKYVARSAKETGCQVRKYKTYRRMPWRNGRGFTHEIARDPIRGQDFAWRLSLADIDRDGAFSAYPGYRRALVLVAGASLHLKFPGHGRRVLDPKRRGTRFDGDWETHCTILQGRCTDLSLIVRRGSAAVVRAPRMLHLKSVAQLVLAGDLCAALFVVEGTVAVIEGIRVRPRTLATHDTLLLARGAHKTLRLSARGRAGARLVLLRWRAGRPLDRERR